MLNCGSRASAASAYGGNGMNWELIKHKICRLLATAAILLGGTMLNAAASGTMPLWAAVVGLCAAVVLLNAVCGILLEAPRRAGGRAPASVPPYSCALCAAATLPDFANPIPCDTHITAASPAQPCLCGGFFRHKILCYNEENAKRMWSYEVAGGLRGQSGLRPGPRSRAGRTVWNFAVRWLWAA